jgi:hypothetical protein
MADVTIAKLADMGAPKHGAVVLIGVDPKTKRPNGCAVIRAFDGDGRAVTIALAEQEGMALAASLIAALCVATGNVPRGIPVQLRENAPSMALRQ